MIYLINVLEPVFIGIYGLSFVMWSVHYSLYSDPPFQRCQHLGGSVSSAVQGVSDSTVRNHNTDDSPVDGAYGRVRGRGWEAAQVRLLGLVHDTDYY